MRSTFLDPGQLSARLELEAAGETPDGQGGTTLAWEPQASLWALIEPMSYAITEQASSAGFALTHRIWLRWCSGVSAGMRLRKGARIFQIAATQDVDETRRYLICHCSEEGA